MSPRWDRDQAANKYPDERWQAVCPRDSVALLIQYDHHTVWIAGRLALLRTYHLAPSPLEDLRDPLSIEVSFTYARGHPAAPAEVQMIIDGLDFRPLAG